jgi:hypothetical protein
VEITACNGTDIFSVKSRNGTLLEQNVVLVERCSPVCSRFYTYVSFDGPVRDEGCLIGLDVYLTYTKRNQVLCHAWPVTVRSYSAFFKFLSNINHVMSKRILLTSGKYYVLVADLLIHIWY